MIANTPAADFIVESASQPATLPSPSTLAQFQISASETAGLSTSSVGRTNANAAAARYLADMHRALAQDAWRELPAVANRRRVDRSDFAGDPVATSRNAARAHRTGIGRKPADLQGAVPADRRPYNLVSEPGPELHPVTSASRQRSRRSANTATFGSTMRRLRIRTSFPIRRRLRPRPRTSINISRSRHSRTDRLSRPPTPATTSSATRTATSSRRARTKRSPT